MRGESEVPLMVRVRRTKDKENKRKRSRDESETIMKRKEERRLTSITPTHPRVQR
jgi:hypothetical protein